MAEQATLTKEQEAMGVTPQDTTYPPEAQAQPVVTFVVRNISPDLYILGHTMFNLTVLCVSRL